MEREELASRLDLIERMIEDGRRDTEYWGWAFVLWGVGHVVSLVVSAAGYPLVWPIAMTACGVAMGIGGARRRERKSTSLGRALAAVWIALGAASFLAGMVGAISGFLPGPTILVLFFVLMGAASFSSGLIVRWPLWTGVGLLWWAAATVGMFAAEEILWWLGLAMAVAAEIGFGVYLMVLERRGTALDQAPRA
jgi:hypothetical protein